MKCLTKNEVFNQKSIILFVMFILTKWKRFPYSRRGFNKFYSTDFQYYSRFC